MTNVSLGLESVSDSFETIVGHVVNIKSKKKMAIGNGFLYPELKCF